jgi:hypothetical protein
MARGQNTAHHPGRQVHRERFIPNEDVAPPHPAGEDDYEPDYEAIHEAKLERRRPTGDTW